MTQDEKDLLLKDLCARLPYGIKGNFLNSDGSLSHDPLLRKVTITYSCLVTADGNEGMVLNGDLKPYLFPLSSWSMTPEQRKEIVLLLNNCDYCLIHGTIKWLDNHPIEFFDWCYKNHFDIRGLIEKGLAIDATGKNIY